MLWLIGSGVHLGLFVLVWRLAARAWRLERELLTVVAGPCANDCACDLEHRCDDALGRRVVTLPRAWLL